MSSIVPPTKRCSKCGIEYPDTIEFFHVDSRFKSGLRTRCKQCACRDTRQHYEANRERMRAKASERVYDPTYQRQYYQTNKEKAYAAVRRWQRANPEKLKAYQQFRRAKRQGSDGSYTPVDMQIQLKMQTDKKGIARCWWCGEALGDDQTVDHRVPLSRGGSNDARNICIAHLSCNCSKSNKMPWEWNGRLL